MRRSAPAEILGSNPAGAWIFVCSDCCVLSGRGLCDELITRPGESYRLNASLYVIYDLLEREDHDPRWAAAPQGIYIYR